MLTRPIYFRWKIFLFALGFHVAEAEWKNASEVKWTTEYKVCGADSRSLSVSDMYGYMEIGRVFRGLGTTALGIASYQ